MGMENGKRVEFKNNAIDLLFDFLGNLAKKIRGIEKSHQDIIKAQNEEDVLFNAVVTGDFKALVPKPEAEKPETTDLGLGETTGEQKSIVATDADTLSDAEYTLLAAVVGGHAHGREIVREAIEQGDALGINTIIAGIIKSAQDLLSLDRGVMGKDYSLLTAIGDALNEYIVFAKEKADGKWDNIEDYLAQQDFFSSRTPLTEEIMRQLFTRRQSAKRVAAVFSYYANMAEEQEGISDGLFAGETEATPKEEIWRRAVEAVTADENNEALDERSSIVATWDGSNGDVRYSIGADEAIRAALEGVTSEKLREGIARTIDEDALAMRLKDGDREKIINGAMKFFEANAEKKIQLSTGAYLYFVPNEKSNERLDKTDAWAEYAIHAVTNDVVKGGKHYRTYNAKKDKLINSMIEEIVAEDKTVIADNGNVRFYKQIDDKHIGMVVARPVVEGNYKADFEEATSAYTKDKIPANAMPLDEVSEANSSESGSSFASTDENIVPHSDERWQIIGEKGVRNLADAQAVTAMVLEAAEQEREAWRRGEDTRYNIVYHGSAADFKKFNHFFMGTGEGAQAFGWGTYVSEVNGIAKGYADRSYQNKFMTYVMEKIPNLHELFGYDDYGDLDFMSLDMLETFIESIKEDHYHPIGGWFSR